MPGLLAAGGAAMGSTSWAVRHTYPPSPSHRWRCNGWSSTSWAVRRHRRCRAWDMRALEPRSIAAAGLRHEALEHSVPTARVCTREHGRYFLTGQCSGAAAPPLLENPCKSTGIPLYAGQAASGRSARSCSMHCMPLPHQVHTADQYRTQICCPATNHHPTARNKCVSYSQMLS